MLHTPPLVFVVDADAALRDSLARSIRGIGLEVECFGRAREFLARQTAGRPACLLLDVSLPDLSGLEVQAQLTARQSGLPVIFLTACQDVITTVRAMKAGALEFFAKPVSPEELRPTILQAIELSRSALVQHMEMNDLQERLRSLTSREREVLELVAAGRLNKQVSSDLGLSVVTVKVHRGRLMRKMRAQSLAHLVGMYGKLAAASSKRRALLGGSGWGTREFNRGALGVTLGQRPVE
jgi:FixJ family two-component response regulator